MSESGDILQIAITAMLAAFGALARLLTQKDKTAIQIATMVSGCLVAAFAGVMAHFLSSYFSLDSNLAYVFAGICGWIGPQILDVFAGIVMDKTGINLETKTADMGKAAAANAGVPVYNNSAGYDRNAPYDNNAGGGRNTTYESGAVYDGRPDNFENMDHESGVNFENNINHE